MDKNGWAERIKQKTLVMKKGERRGKKATGRRSSSKTLLSKTWGYSLYK